MSPAVDETPALRADLLSPPDLARLEPLVRAQHPPRILLLYGSLRERSFSRLLVEEAAGCGASSYYLPAVLADPISADFGLMLLKVDRLSVSGE